MLSNTENRENATCENV